VPGKDASSLSAVSNAPECVRTPSEWKQIAHIDIQTDAARILCGREYETAVVCCRGSGCNHSTRSDESVDKVLDERLDGSLLRRRGERG